MFLLEHLFSQREALLISEEDTVLKNNNSNTPKTFFTFNSSLLVAVNSVSKASSHLRCEALPGLSTFPRWIQAVPGYCRPLKAFHALK